MDELKKLKVTQLKERLKELGLSLTGKKDELIQRILDHDHQTAEQPSVSLDQQTNPPSPPPTIPPLTPPPPELQELPPSKRVRISPALATEPNGHNGVNVSEPAQGQQEEEIVEEEEDDMSDLEAGPTLAVGGTGSDLYLDTVNRDMLDFDFERLCSVTLSNINIYACLVCGKYFQGRSRTSPAYAHSIGCDHHVFINLQSEKVYVLPDGYEVSDPSLDDIKYLLNPTFTPELLRRLDAGLHPPAFDLHATSYLPGFVGLNNIKANDYLNVVVHALAHVPPLRDYLICRASATDSELVRRFATLLRKLWNPRAFKAQVSPHEFGQEVSTRSGRRFRLTEQADPLEFLGWLLNTLHSDLGGSKKVIAGSPTSIIDAAFRGEVRVEEHSILTRPDTGEVGQKPKFDLGVEVNKIKRPFLFLTIDLPPPPVFQDSVQKNIIPQVNLSQVLSKYDGTSIIENSGKLKKHKCTNLPPYLILHIKRFTSNNFVEEKNPTIVNFQTHDINMQSYTDEIETETLNLNYDLLSNITYFSVAGTAKEESQWKVQVHTRPDIKGEEKWFQIQDLIVEEVNRQMVFLGESYIQVWERKGIPNKLEFKKPDVNLSDIKNKNKSKAKKVMTNI
ncbi:hypothetical protein CROQUDRAFT_655439 [Cronartium quercuum f. sp. fusiforme G11]|uniref:Uncharacterized protein n=1 Tax=Cronartium quercuum f. sp. fusiforme G11 TaxID=708437 RepID=A0A9P6TES7_9BASI|nr:hypothetical protein CROQUDRAFT_655439 [Cronartium quercuum f. sp. fusiforme G11]